MKINRNFDNLAESYLFAEVALRTEKYTAENPDKKIIRMGIGDVTLPLNGYYRCYEKSRR